MVEFYLSDSVSRRMPGKDYVSMLVEGQGEHIQKRLLLFNLKNAYKQFLDENEGFKVGLTKFKELRPKNAVLAVPVACTVSVFAPSKCQTDGGRC